MRDMIQNLKDAGCREQTILRVQRLCENGKIADAVIVLRRHRCDLMKCLHAYQEQIDCLDFLLRCLEKEQKKSKK